MKIIGLSGQSGAGKTTVLETFSELGFVVLDCDKVSRIVMEKGMPCTVELISTFGREIASEEGEIYRKKLAEKVFFNKDLLEKLTEITHRYIKAYIFEKIEEARSRGEKVFVIDAPLLFESGLDKICHVTLAVTADRETRISRITERDRISRELAEKRIDAQISEEELKKLAQETIENNKTKDDLKKAVLNFAERIGLKE
ncbi:MAG: dephospho-CoA kinase [Clostridia bacterium]|nr:dephospho-CoA kinase [Clostridia bacterium]